ncbi:transposase [Streptococcus ruminantium]|uniref:Transposase n=1 Tax=Streptococcus ruminantium TaxID=1917441 RepID=A0A2Z5U298_9STRE|nr:transposase [Streptococcus ruminantium]
MPLELSACLLQNHVVFTIEQVVNELSDGHYQAFYHDFGRPSYHPKMLLSVLLY